MDTPMMRRLLILGALLLPITVHAEEDRRQKDFAAANERLLSGDVKGSVALYEHLLADGVRNEDLFFNLGNAYAESGDLVQAALSYERALKVTPGDDDARANLQLVRAKLHRERGEEAEPTDPVDWIEPVVAPFDSVVAAWLAIAANALLFGLLAIRRLSSKEKLRRACAFGIGLSVVLLIVAGSVVLGHGMIARDVRGVVLASGALKAGPDDRFATAGQCLSGDRVRIIGSDTDWIQIKTPEGTTGWAPSKSIARL